MARSTYFDLGRGADACPGSESGYAQRFQCGNVVKRLIWTGMVSNTPSPAPVMNFPISQRVNSYYQHIFEIPGMSFLLFVGKQLTKHIREFCAARSPERIIYFTDIDSLIRADNRRVFATSPATPKLRRQVDAEIQKRGEPPAS